MSNIEAKVIAELGKVFGWDGATHVSKLKDIQALAVRQTAAVGDIWMDVAPGIQITANDGVYEIYHGNNLTVDMRNLQEATHALDNAHA